MSEEDPFEALRRGNPVPPPTSGIGATDSSGVVMQLIVGRRRSPRRLALLVAAVGASCLVILAGATFVTPAPPMAGFACFLDSRLDAETVFRGQTASAAPEECARVLGRDANAAGGAGVVPCRLASGLLAVFPGPADICGQLGLVVAETDGSPPGVVVDDLTVSLARGVNLSRCVDVATASAVAHAELTRLGLSTWDVELSAPDGRAAPAPKCATVTVQESRRRIGITAVPLPAAMAHSEAPIPSR